MTIFRGRAKALDAVRTLTINFRSREELLDVINAAFAPEFGERFSPLRAGRHEPPADDSGALRLFALDPPTGAPPVELLITDTTTGTTGSAWPAAATSRGAAPRRA